MHANGAAVGSLFCNRLPFLINLVQVIDRRNFFE